MPGTNAGTGTPLYFKCSRCRSRYARQRGGIHRVEMTGRVHLAPMGVKHKRTSYWRFEYRCRDCKHVGWSRHIEAERAYVRSGFNLPEVHHA